MNITTREFLDVINLLEAQQLLIDELIKRIYIPGICLECGVNYARNKYCKVCALRMRRINDTNKRKLLRRVK